ncbi:MAG: response regulator [Elusimicrobiota bacterium]|nr:response regulator [Elusimicrobiota bacterium]
MNRTLLVVDDDKTFRRLISRVFGGTAWRVETAEDGMAALESIFIRLPDVILLDLNMPRMGGRELLTFIRKDARLHMIPVIIFSDDILLLEQAFAAGLDADGFISKFFNPLELISRVERTVRRGGSMPGPAPAFLPETPTI